MIVCKRMVFQKFLMYISQGVIRSLSIFNHLHNTRQAYVKYHYQYHHTAISCVQTPLFVCIPGFSFHLIIQQPKLYAIQELLTSHPFQFSFRSYQGVYPHDMSNSFSSFFPFPSPQKCSIFLDSSLHLFTFTHLIPSIRFQINISSASIL